MRDDANAGRRAAALAFAVERTGYLPVAAGIGLRAPHVAGVLAEHPQVPWFEVHSENHYVDGGRALSSLLRLRAHYPLSLHGVSLSIGNEGPRIPEAALDRIFEKFYQVEASSEGYSSGTGLGLAFCDMAIKAHGGWVEARNNPDKGCTFTIHLPYPPGGRL